MRQKGTITAGEETFMRDDTTGMTRRKMLVGAAAGLALGLPGLPRSVDAAGDPDLAVISGEPATAARKAVEALGGMARFLQKGQRVVLKPNMSFASGPERASNTHPAVVYTVAQLCLEAGAEQVMIVDNPLQSAELCLRRAGVAEACKGLKNTYVQMFTDRKFYREIKIPHGKVLDRVEVIKEVLDSQVLISLPQAKSHSNTGISMGIKGLMGLIWDRWSFHSKYNINEALADLATVLRPTLTILDATRALTTGGPGGPGEVVKPHLVIAGTDPVAVDSFGVGVAPWYGQQFKGRQVEHLLAASQRGLGKIDVDALNILKAAA
jgi:uncharacterized protein (DUF362 family)